MYVGLIEESVFVLASKQEGEQVTAGTLVIADETEA